MFESLSTVIGEKRFFKNALHNLIFIISGGAYMAMFVSTPSLLIVMLAGLAMLIIVSGCIKDVFSSWKSGLSPLSVMLSIIVLGLSAYCSFSTLRFNSVIAALAHRLGSGESIVALGIVMLYAIFGAFFVCFVVNALLRYAKGLTRRDYYGTPLVNTITFKEIAVIVITSFGVIAICSHASPLYPFNVWDDVNCFMTVGKAMLHGKIVYRDIFEQKGPLLYFVHLVAAFISERSFIGVYFIEVISCFATLYCSLKAMRLYKNNISVFSLPVIAAVIYGSQAFKNGDSAEELCLPLVIYAIYIGLKSFRDNKLPDIKESIMIGITSSFMLWIKFSMLGFYIGWIIIPAIVLIAKGKIASLIKLILLIAAGIAIVSLPIIIYFVANNALEDLWTVYFYDNLFIYSVSGEGSKIISFANNMFIGIKSLVAFNLIPMLIASLCLLSTSKENGKAALLFLISCFAFGLLFVYVGGREYPYYSLIFSAFVPFGFATLSDFIHLHTDIDLKNSKKYVGGLICVMSLVVVFLISPNTYLLQYKKCDLPQYKFAEIIKQNEDATLLNYGFLDGGFYMAADILPSSKYFCNLNIPLEDIMDTQNELVENGRVDFIVTKNDDADFELYNIVATETMDYNGIVVRYNLYQLAEKGE